MYVLDEALLIKACISVTFSFKASFEVLLFYLYPVLNLTTTIHYTHKKITRISFKLYTNPNHIK